MGSKKPSFLIFVHILLLLLLLLVPPTRVTGQQDKIDGVTITPLDFQSLKSLKAELIDARDVLKTWNGSRTSACSGSWAGIKCLNGHVIAIQLPFKALGGRLSNKIGNFKELRKLSLHDNLIKGTIPSSIGSLPKLRGLYLFNNRFTGSIPPSLGNSAQLQAIDLSNNLLNGVIPSRIVGSSRVSRVNLSFNSLTGSIPESFTRLYSVKFIALQYNNLSGVIPELGKLGDLEELNLSHNGMNGSIPGSIGNLSRIVYLDLSENKFTGEIPGSIGKLVELRFFNVSDNELSGQIPSRLVKRFNSSSFEGNLGLCGFGESNPCFAPAPVSESPEMSPESGKTSRKGRKLSTKDVILIVVGGLLAVLFVLCCVLLCCLIRKRTGSSSSGTGKSIGRGGEKRAVVAGEASEAGPTGGKLVLFDGPFVFTADDLLCATAEIMGKSPYGTVYKATLEDGNQVAVKRLREKLAKSPKEFEIEVGVLGRIRHPNLLPLRAYYLGPKGEKLLVFDYLSKGSLSSFLHARGAEITIDWPTRMKIAIGVTRGLNHLHNQENLVHGNLTSSDVYLDEKNKAKVSDYGIQRLMTDTANTNVSATAGATGYRAPELPKTKKTSTKTDIYSLGVIILELLTGKSPSETIEGSDLPQWVASTVKEEWTNEVFDLELMRDVSTTGDEMLNTLKLALHLVDPSPDERPDVQQVLQQLEEINPRLAAETTEESAAEKEHH